MKYQISIPEPCSEDWNNMTPTEQGRFCASCQTEVLDFTNKTDAELIQFLQSGKKACGRYRKNQLKTYAVPKAPRFWHRYFRYGLAAGLGFLSLLGFSQSSKEQVVIQQTWGAKEKPVKDVEADVEKDTVPELVISGSVVDADGMPLSFASVVYRFDGQETGVSTDFDGLFSITLAPRKGTVDLEFSYLGYETLNVTFTKSQSNVKVVLQEGEVGGLILGGAMIKIGPPEENFKGDPGTTRFKKRGGNFFRW